MSVYIVIYLIVMLLAYFQSRKIVLMTSNSYVSNESYSYVSLIFFILFLLIGFRDNLGIDDRMYSATFEQIKTYGYPWRTIELSFILISKLVIYLNGTCQLVFVIYSGIAFYFLNKALKKMIDKKNYLFFFAIFLSLILYSSLTLMRQFVAASFLLNSYCCIRNNEKKRSLVYFVLAVFFHNTALIGLIYYFFTPVIGKMKNSTKILILIALFSFQFVPVGKLVLSFIGMVLGKFLSSYKYFFENKSTAIFFDPLGTIEMFFLIVYIFMLAKNKNILKMTKSKDMESLTFLYFAVRMILCQFGFINRLSYYLYFALALYIPNIRYYFKVKSRYFFDIFVFIVFFLFFIYATINYTSGADEICYLLPYKYNISLFY